MKYTTKRASFPFLETWIEKSKIDGELHPDINYSQLLGHEKDVIKRALLEDQGYICCYTGHSIEMETSHIEHVKPQSVCREEGNFLDTLSYNNMLAAYPHTPRGYLGEKGCEYGAQVRGNLLLLITPLMADCEQHFRFLPSGHIEAAEQLDNDAVLTIQRLKLDNGRLIDIRKAVISETFTLLRQAATSKSDLVQLLERLVDTVYNPDAEGRLRPFCFVIHWVVVETLEKVNATIPGREE